MRDPLSNLGQRSGIGWPCANCGKQVNKTVAWLKENTSYSCPSCGVATEILEADRQRFLASLKNVDDVVDIFRGKKSPPEQKH